MPDDPLRSKERALDNRHAGGVGALALGWGTTLLVLARVVGYGLSLVNSVLLARVLGVERLGTYAYAMGLTALFGLLPNMGISTVVTRTIAQDPGAGSGVMRAAVRAQAWLAVAVLIAVPAFAALLPGQPVPLGYVVLAATQLALGTLSWPYLAVLGGRGRYDRAAIAELVATLAGTVSFLVAAVCHGGVATFLWAQVLGAGCAVITTRWIASAFLPRGEEPALRLRRLLHQAIPFGAISAVQSFYTRVDILLLGQMASTTALGLYSAAYKPINMVVYFGGTLAGPLFPLMAQTPQTSAPAAFRRTMRGLGVVAPAMALICSGLAGPVLRVFYGSAYAAAAPIMVLLAWSAAANWLYAPLGVALQARGRERWWLTGLGGGFVVNLLGNLWAIPHWGAIGAATATLASEVALLGFATVLIWWELSIPASLQSALYALAAVAGGIALWGLSGLGPLLATLGSLTVYGACLIALRSITAQDIATIIGWSRRAVGDWPRG